MNQIQLYKRNNRYKTVFQPYLIRCWGQSLYSQSSSNFVTNIFNKRKTDKLKIRNKSTNVINQNPISRQTWGTLLHHSNEIRTPFLNFNPKNTNIKRKLEPNQNCTSMFPKKISTMDYTGTKSTTHYSIGITNHYPHPYTILCSIKSTCNIHYVICTYRSSPLKFSAASHFSNEPNSR